MIWCQEKKHLMTFLSNATIQVYKIIHRGLKCTMKTKCYSVRSESPLEGIIIQESVRLRKRERET